MDRRYFSSVRVTWNRDRGSKNWRWIYQYCCSMSSCQTKVCTKTWTNFILKLSWLRPRSHVTGYDSYPGKLYSDRPCVHTFPSYPDNLPFSIRRMLIRLWRWRTNLSAEQFSEPKHVWTACPGRVKKDKCECKAYPHKVCPDRNRIWLRVNKIRSLSRYMWMLFLSDGTFFG